MSENRLDEFTIEEIQCMYLGSQYGFKGQTKLSLSEADALISKFHDELTKELKKRQKEIADEIERTTPRCECCKQRIEQ